MGRSTAPQLVCLRGCRNLDSILFVHPKCIVRSNNLAMVKGSTDDVQGATRDSQPGLMLPTRLRDTERPVRTQAGYESTILDLRARHDANPDNEFQMPDELDKFFAEWFGNNSLSR